jgi:transposase-like protein
VRAGYVNASWTLGPRLTFAPGARVSSATLAHRTALSRWISSAFVAGGGLTLGASAAIVEAPPQVEQLFAGDGNPELAPEHEALVDVSVEQRLQGSLRWKATLFQRTERDFLREPDASALNRFENRLAGTARGLELLVERSNTRALSGWIAYSFGKARQTDAESGERFWADFDRRHGVSAAAVGRLPHRTTVTIDFKGGTGFPVPGSFEIRDGGLFASGSRNEVRLPSYARLDVRASRTMQYAGRRIMLFAEVLNVLNRRNLGVTDGTIAPATGAAVGFVRALFPRTPSAGVLIEF